MPTDQFRTPAAAQGLLAALVDSANDAIVAGDLAGTILVWNAAAERLYGYTAGEIIGQSIAVLYPPGAEPQRRAIMEAIWRGDAPQSFEGMRRRKDGTLFPARVTISPIRDADGTMIGASAISRDISEERGAAEALRQAEDKLRRIFMAVPAGICVSDIADDRLLEVNDAFARTFGYSVDEMVGRATISLGLWDDVSDRDRLTAQLVAYGELRDVEVRGRTRTGELLLLRASFHLTTVAGKRLSLTTFADVTGRRLAEEQYRELVDGVRDAVFAITAQGILTSLNPAFEHITGLARADWIGQPFAALLHPADVERAHEALSQVADNTHLSTPPFRIRTASGVYREVDMEVTAHRDHGRLTGFLGIGRDVTERLELEAQFRQAQKMEAIGRLAGGVAHDFNNLLTVIIGVGQLALESIDRDTPAYADVQSIVGAGQRAAELTRQMLAFSRRQVLQPRTVDLNEVIAGITKMLGRLIGEDVTLATVPARNLGLIRADPGQIGQAIINLAVNARDAMPSGGTLTLSTANVEIDDAFVREHRGAMSGPHVQLRIDDTGTGMSNEVLAHVFEPFFTTKENGRGTGLGLSTVYGIVEQSDGKIWVESVVNQGTTFTLVFPRVADDAREAPPVQTAGVRRGTETILVAEDNAEVRGMIVRVLQQDGYTVLTAASGADAIAIATSHTAPIHLVVADVVMPDANGFALGARLTAMRPGMRALYMSGYTDDVMLRDSVIDGDTPFLQKPLTPASLGRMIRQVLDAPPA